MKHQSINLHEKLAGFTDTWSPRIVAELNDYQIKVARLEGDFVWHKHDETDELFLCLHGKMAIELRDGVVHLAEGELYVVPRGIEHRPRAAEDCHVLIVEPRGVINTGDAVSKLTAAGDRWI